MSLTVRRMEAGDVDRVAPLFDGYRRFYGQPTDLPRAAAFLRERLDRDESVVLFAERAGEALGFTQLYPIFSSVGTDRVWLLNDLFVADTARRLGVGEALLFAARDFGQSRGALRLVLETTRDNQIAQALYRKLGWQADATQWFHLPLR
ncbi:GNAT family N-acetyltransferase [Arenimonas sp.]|uniref:GNAT family N-acetyltransferase n=1 Tax=Arenimonas sp. TaxID=1872635 RepID=UPI0039E37043